MEVLSQQKKPLSYGLDMLIKNLIQGASEVMKSILRLYLKVMGIALTEIF